MATSSAATVSLSAECSAAQVLAGLESHVVLPEES